ncbi:MAG TPA: condensation domain-containing protein, partial [Terrimicrobiaceae bacterium]
EAQEPFNLSRGPLLRFRLLKLAPGDHVLFWSCHHIISDGWSGGIFNRELSTLYASFSDARPSDLVELPVQYADYALWERRQLEGGKLQRQLAYWRTQLNDLPGLDLPVSRPRPSSHIFDGAEQTLLLSIGLCNDLRNFSKGEGATMAMLQLAAFELLLGRLSGQDDVAVGLPIVGRNSIESERLIGLFGNTLVLRSKLDSNLTFRQLLAQVRHSSLEAYSHQEVPFEKLVEVLSPERALNRHPLFEVLFNYLSLPRSPLDLPGLSVERLRQESFQAKFPMTLYLEEVREGLLLRLAYQSALFSPERIAHILDQFQHLLTQIAENPDRPIGVYSLVTEAAGRLLPN